MKQTAGLELPPSFHDHYVTFLCHLLYVYVDNFCSLLPFTLLIAFILQRHLKHHQFVTIILINGMCT